MNVIRVNGGKSLKGEVLIGGSKNAALPLMAACLLTEDTLVLSNLPHLIDVITMNNLLMELGVNISIDGNIFGKTNGRTILFNAANVNNIIARYDIVRKMRASILVLGPLLSRFKKAKVSLPGGCAIGSRPVDLHIKALQQMGANIEIQNGYIDAYVDGKLKGAEIHFDKISVGATENILMAATLAEGITTLYNAAKEPEIVDLANCLNSMGAKIEGIGSSIIKIEGVDKLHGAQHKIVPDRIEAGTYAIAAAITGGEILLKNVEIDMISNIVDVLKRSGVSFIIKDDGILVKKDKDNIIATNIETDSYPGFPTDMQAQFMALMCVAKGVSIIRENIFENRFMHVAELRRMGADITLSGCNAVIKGINFFTGAEIMATDLRASVSLVLASLAAKGTSILGQVYHVDRGYEYIESKLLACGADIERIKI